MGKKTRIPWNDAAGAAANARAHLPALVSEYFQTGRKLQEKAPSPADLHAFRLRTKRLRYTLELFRPCYGPGLEQRLEALRHIQTFLGDINDCAATLRLVDKLLPEGALQRRQVERALAARSGRLIAAFRRSWRAQFDAAGREAWWTGYLGQTGGKRTGRRR